MKTTAIVLAGGSGSRMNSQVKKQFLEIAGKPIIYYSLMAFQQSAYIDEIVLVCGEDDIAYCRKEIVEHYQITKVSHIVPGGKERYHSVREGLTAAAGCDYVLIHDGARPMVNEAIIQRVVEALPVYKACVAGMPVKDTIKLSDTQQMVEATPQRERLWMIQTPQAFSYPLIYEAYQHIEELEAKGIKITDDAMVAEETCNQKIKLIEGSYKNIKITTPEDLAIAEVFLLS